ncbi:MAG TPA: hypothetical protein VM925_08275 [Labilithrix sp.]|nr:hypothetical protein [Labilithrix sp.]
MSLRFCFLLLPLAAACSSVVHEDVASPPTVERTARRLASFEDEATVAIAVDRENAYVTTRVSAGQGGSIVRIPLEGVGSSVVLASLEVAPFAIAIDDDWIYFTVRDRGTVHRIKKTGGAVETVAEQPEHANGAEAIALDADHVYWTAVGGVFRAPKAGGAAERIAEDDLGADALAVDSGEAFWIARGTTGDAEGALYKVATSGGRKIALGTGPIFMPTWAFSIAVSGRFVFVPDPARGRVYRVDRTTGEIGLVAEQQAMPKALATDGSRVFWSTGGTAGADTDVRTLSSAPIAGGPVEKIVETRQTNIFAIAVNERGAYFTDYVSTGSVYAASREASTQSH